MLALRVLAWKTCYGSESTRMQCQSHLSRSLLAGNKTAEQTRAENFRIYRKGLHVRIAKGSVAYF